jgi:hypothetical protein
MFAKTTNILTRRALIGGLAALLLAATTPVFAHSYRDDDRGSFSYAYRIGKINGHRAGFWHGRRDGARGLSFNFWSDDEYQSATRGYSRSFGSISAYRSGFRSGYKSGYASGFRQFSWRSRWDRWTDRDRRLDDDDDDRRRDRDFDRCNGGRRTHDDDDD